MSEEETSILSKIEGLRLRDEQKAEMLREHKRLRDPEEIAKFEEILDLPWGVHSTKQKDTMEGRWSYADLLPANKKKVMDIEKLVRGCDPKHSHLYLFGPQNIGQREMAEDIARITGRPFQEIRLEQCNSPASLLGSKGQMGQVMKAVKEAKCCDPVIFFDDIEMIWRRKSWKIIDQLADPRKSRAFVDRSVGIPFDLSNAIFILSQNLEKKEEGSPWDFIQYSPIHFFKFGLPTRRRLEIAKNILFPTLLEKHHLDRSPFSDDDLKAIIDDYTVENGVKQLTDVLDLLLSRRSEWTEFRSYFQQLGVEPYCWTRPEERLKVIESDNRVIVGGSRLLGVRQESGRQYRHIEGNVFGRLGEGVGGNKGGVVYARSEYYFTNAVVNETQRLATVLDMCFNVLKNNPDKYGNFKKAVKVEFSEHGDGRSYMSSVFLSLFSLVSGRRIRGDSATTGTITLSGRIRKVDAVYWKAKAAQKDGVRRIILSNWDSDLKFEDEFGGEMEFVYVATVDELIEEMMEK
ncbi:hypothetical protein QR680_008539 [Steinernema hermaphroditum]|uniref:Lon proteolytic domain-containing protein n=1 Tax=Steinernema hermaphroditum TaxID=289476 RepID=A0AA39IGZ9_9BILA|nr:hypothetical protein QR680_008539 [Steinernema hermaphroditum]